MAVAECHTALPHGQPPATPVVGARLAKRHAVNADGKAQAADSLAGKAHDAFQELHAAWQISAVGKELFQRSRRLHDNEVSHLECVRGLDAIEPDRHAG